MNWDKLAFDYIKCNTMVCSFNEGHGWGPLESRTNDKYELTLMSGSLHYAIEVFEGLKAYSGRDGKIRIFRPRANAARMIRSAEFLGMPPVPEEMFVEAVTRAVNENRGFIPPYESGASMYIRPFMICTNPQLTLELGKEFMFVVAVTPTGNFTGTSFNPTKALLVRDHDRAAPLGTGSHKIGANYAASMPAGVKAKKEGYSSILYLDSKEKKYIDEFSSSNFFAIRGNSYITPDSPSVLPSITNKSLREIASHLGMTVEHRPVPVEELATFDEAGACGTALVITPVHEIYDKEMEIRYYVGSPVRVGEKSRTLYKYLTGIQFGEIEDSFGWCHIL